MKNNKQVNLLGISGKASSGKDLAGKIIQYLTSNGIEEEYSFEEYADISNRDWFKKNIASDWQIKKYGGKLKEIVSILTGIPIEDMEKKEVKNNYLGEEWNRWTFRYKETTHKITLRQALQWVGTDLFRDKFHPNTWINALFADYHGDKFGINSRTGEPIYAINGLPNWLVTDVRFPDEVKAIKDRGGIVIRINRFCYDSAEDFLVTHPDPIVSKLGTHLVETYKGESLRKQLETYSKYHGYIPLSDQHKSETTCDSFQDFNWTIDNTKDIPHLIEEVKKCLKHYKIL